MRIRVCDLETTSDSPETGSVVEIGWCDVELVTLDLIGAPYAWEIRNHGSVFVNPGRPIPPETKAIHHITERDVVGAPSFEAIAPHICQRDAPDAFAAHSAEFERKFITDEMTGGKPCICSYKAALRLWPDAPGHSNQTLRYWREPVGLMEHLTLPAHRAGPDAYVTAHHLRDMLEEASIERLIEWTEEPALLRRCKLGQWRNGGKGTPWEDVDDGFLEWILSKDFDENTAFTARHHLQKRQADAEAERREEQKALDRAYRQKVATMQWRPPPTDQWFADKPIPFSGVQI